MRAVITFTAVLLVTLSFTAVMHGQTRPSSEQALEAGRAALQQENYAEAIRLLQEGLKQYPNDRRLKVELGRAYLYNRQDDQAIQLFREVLREEPSNRTAKLELARALGYHRNYEESNQLYQELLSSNPNDEAAAFGLIRNLLHKKRTAEARRELERALARHPESKRLQEYKQRLDQQEGGIQNDVSRQERREQPTAANQPTRLQGSGGYFTDSTGHHSWRVAQSFDQQILQGLTSRLRVEERSLWESRGPTANVLWGTGEIRLRPSRFFVLSGGGGGVRFADRTAQALYRGELEFHPARRLWLTGGFSRRPISPTFLSAQFDLLAEGWHAGVDWYPRAWRMNAAWSREHYSDGNSNNRLEAELLRWVGNSRLAFGAGYRFNYLAFRASLFHGYFDPSQYFSHLGLTGVRFHLGRSFRVEYLAGVGAESISAGPYHVAWEVGLRNRVQLRRWELGGDYFYYHLAQSTGAFRAQAGRALVAYHF